MRYLILFVIILIPLSGISARTPTPTPPPTDTQTPTPTEILNLTRNTRAFGVTVYYPDTLDMVSEHDEIHLFFEDGSGDVITITSPQAFDTLWNIPQSDVSTMTQALYDLQRIYYPTDTLLTDGIEALVIGNYRAEYFALHNEGTYTLFFYVFETPIGIMSASFETHETEYLSKMDLMMTILKAMDTSGLPVGVIARTAPTPDVRMGERVSSLDETITYQMPFGWVRDSASEQADLIADTQATLDSLNNGFVVPSDNLAVGMVSPNFVGVFGVDLSTPYAIITELQTIMELDAQAFPIWHY
ncbi:MAG: hypothetical protein KJ043_23575, partial [Anaerolineae bacterium]|nr:hypothetical protein [Anaerolineae bacterium]